MVVDIGSHKLTLFPAGVPSLLTHELEAATEMAASDNCVVCEGVRTLFVHFDDAARDFISAARVRDQAATFATAAMPGSWQNHDGQKPVCVKVRTSGKAASSFVFPLESLEYDSRVRGREVWHGSRCLEPRR